MKTEPTNLLSPTEFEHLFETFREEAARLELLPRYRVDEEAEDLAAYEAGIKVMGGSTEWCNEIRDANVCGRKYRRLRHIPTELDIYIKFEIDTVFRQSILAGEEIRYFQDPQPEKQSPPDIQDFWLFDRKTVVLMNYDDQGSYLGASLAPARRVDTLIQYWSDKWNDSSPIEELHYWKIGEG